MKTIADYLKQDYTDKVFRAEIDASRESITSLKGSPKETTGSFYCDYNELTSLEFAPKKVGGMFECSHNKITSLEFAPNEIGDTFFCVDNPISEETFMKEIIIYQIKAKYYRYGNLKKIPFKEIEKEFNDYILVNKVQSKGFRTLLGLNK